MSNQADFPVAIRESQVLNASDFQKDVESLASRIQEADSRCCLASKSSYRFAVGFLALLHTKKTIVLPASCTPGSLAECEQVVDAFVTDDEGLKELPSEGGSAYSFKLAPIEDGQIELFTSGSSGERKYSL